MHFAKEYTQEEISTLGKNKCVRNATKYSVLLEESFLREVFQSWKSGNNDKAVITSGGYERYFEENGKRYPHILDTRTGAPAEQDLCSVTIVSKDGTLADGLSTSLFVMGKDKAIEYWKAQAEKFDVVLVTKDQEIYVTEGLKKEFHSENAFQMVLEDE